MMRLATALDAFQDALGRVGLSAAPRTGNATAWEAAWARLAYQPVSAAAPMLNYQHAYLEGAGWEVAEASLTLLNDGQPAGIWPLTLGGPSGPRLTSQGAPVGGPLFIGGLSPRTAKRLTTQCIEVVQSLTPSLAEPPRCSSTIQPSQAASGLSEWYQQWLSLGASPEVRHDLFVHLELPLAEIRAGFRKSYRPLISMGLRDWKVGVLDSVDGLDSVWPDFVALHRDVAGRATRSAATWELQRQMIAAGEAILVHLSDPKDGRMVGGGFFQSTRDEALYAVAAYDRSLFDKPLGHAVQATAIERFKAAGMRWYRVGERHFASDQPPPSSKELAIAAFKQGFASHLVPRFLLTPPGPIRFGGIE